MTPEEFRQIALSFAGVEEREHMGHPDFRIAGKIFATLAYLDHKWGMVKLPPEAQHEVLTGRPEAFEPAAGAWGRAGSTMVNLSAAGEDVVHPALETAWRHAQAAKPSRRVKPRAQAR